MHNSAGRHALAVVIVFSVHDCQSQHHKLKEALVSGFVKKIRPNCCDLLFVLAGDLWLSLVVICVCVNCSHNGFAS